MLLSKNTDPEYNENIVERNEKSWPVQRRLKEHTRDELRMYIQCVTKHIKIHEIIRTK